MLGLLRSSPKSPTYKRPPLRESNGFHPAPSGRQREHGRKVSYFKRGLSILFCTLVALTVLVSLTSLLLYINCSNAIGFEIIPKSHQLCHDVYQFMQTGRIPPLTWDYKASFGEVIRIIQEFFNFGWFKHFDLTALKDNIVAGFIACKDAVVGFPWWIYENGGQVAQLVWKLLPKLFSTAWGFMQSAFFGLLYAVFYGFELGKLLATDAFSNISAFWQKVMDSMKK